MRKLTALVTALILSLSLSACGGGKTGGDAVELTVFAAASLTETLTELGQRYESDHPEVTVTFNFDSSGTLKTQIEEGAQCDLFLSAGQKQMNQLDGADTTGDNTEGLDLLLPGSRVDLLENKVVLTVRDDGAQSVSSFDDMAEQLKNGTLFLAMGNEDVPVGQYTQRILDYYGLSDETLAAAGCVTYGSNVKEVTTQVAEGSVDCGVIYATDARSAALSVVDEATAEMCERIIYPAAVLSGSSHPQEAQAFLDYLQTEESMEVFHAVGFAEVP